MSTRELRPLPFPLPFEPQRQLTSAERAFADAYLVHQGQPMAVIEQHAGLAAGKGHVMFADGAVRAFIDRELDARTERARLKADDVDSMLADIVTLDIGELVDENNHLRPIRDLPPRVRRAISALDLVVFEGRVVGVKPIPTSKIKALELVMKRLRMLDEKRDQVSSTSNTLININYGDAPKQVEVPRPVIDVTPDLERDFRSALGLS